ncbi:MAG: class I SAM-dependent methyltransferase, partial [Candidatus Hydrothermarchaeales archaeon]
VMEEEVEERFPEFLGFLLDNPIRRLLGKPEKRIKELGLVDSKVLEVGCGPGFFTIPLAENNQSVVSFDLSSKFLKKTRRMAEKKEIDNTTFIRCEASKIPLREGVFDRAFVHFVYHEIKDREDFISELARVLKRNGEVVLVEVEPASGLKKLFGPPGASSDTAKMKFKTRFEGLDVRREGGRRYVLRAKK